MVEGLVKTILIVVGLKMTSQQINKEFCDYVDDVDDAHIVAGAHQTKARFLVSYNLKDYRIDHIKKDFGIIVLTPGLLLQYLRSTMLY